MALKKSCQHTHFYPDIEGTPTKKEINIFRLWLNPDCNKWVSFVGVQKGDKTYNDILGQVGFDKAYKNINWY